MQRILLLTAVLMACSNDGNGLSPNQTKNGGSGSTTTPTTQTFTSTTTGSQTTDQCATAAPTGGAGVPALADCEYTPSPTGTPFAAKVEWSMTQEMFDPSTGALLPAYTFTEFDGFGGVFQAPVVRHMTDDNGDGAVNNDDIPDIAVVMGHPDERLDGVLRIISGNGSAVHDSISWESHTNANGVFDYAPYHYAGVAVADIDADGVVEVATLAIRSSDSLCFPAIYEVRTTPLGAEISLEHVYGGVDYNCGAHAPALADLDDDGQMEVIYGRATMNSDLTLKWYGAGGRGWYGRSDYPWPDGYWNSGYHPVAWDLDGDGSQMEVVAGRTVYTSTGDTFCELGWYDGSTWVEATDGYPAVADVARYFGDTQGEPEIVLTGNGMVRVFHGVPDYDPNGLNRCTLVGEIGNRPEDDPSISASLPPHPSCDPTATAFGGPATIADFDGDGQREIAVAGSCWYSVYQFDSSGDLERYALTATKDWSSASTGSTVFDFNGDGSSEIVFSDEEAVYVWGVDTTPGLAAWDRLVPYLIDTEHKSWTIHEYPLVADVDGDGKAEILVVNSHLPGFEDHFGIYALGAEDDDWVSARDIWHQHGYYVTNVSDAGDVGYAAPNYAPYTAADHNSFRLQAPGSFGALAAPNLFADASVCQSTCGDITVWVQASNEGSFIATGPDAIVSLYGVDPSGVRTLIGGRALGVSLPPMTQSDPVEFTVSNWGGYDHLEAVVDDDTLAGPVSGGGVAKECDESDNATVVSLAGLCP